MSVTKRKREKPCKPRGVDSKGVNGATKHPLSEMEKVLAHKGLFVSFQHVDCKAPWRGVTNVTVPYDRDQVAFNRIAYPHIFTDSR